MFVVLCGAQKNKSVWNAGVGHFESENGHFPEMPNGDS
jgi:hypothetical protein